MARRNIFADILGGQFILSSKVHRHWPYIVFIFVLAVLLIFLRFTSKDLLLTKERNNKVIKELRAEDSNKKLQLLELSQREKIDRLLEKNELELKAPQKPAYQVKKFK